MSTTVNEVSAHGAMAMFTGIVKAMRPRQAVKNGLVLVPLFFTVNAWFTAGDISGMALIVGRAIAGAALFTLLSGAVYLVNDAVDVEKDRAHPKKRNRPLAAGAISVSTAWGVAATVGIAALALSYVIGIQFGVVATIFIILNFAYSLYLKNVVLLDVMTVAAGFVLRAVAGSVIIDHAIVHRAGVDVELDLAISPWLYVVTALGALFIALAKRRGELLTAGDSAGAQRSILDEYSLPLLDLLIGVVATATLIAYTLYTFSGSVVGSANVPDDNSMMITIPFVAYGIFRYLYLLYVHNMGEEPEEIVVSDWPFIGNIVLWLFVAAGVLMWARLEPRLCWLGVC